MSRPVSPDPDRPCPECGALNAAQASVCWMCRRGFTGGRTAAAKLSDFTPGVRGASGEPPGRRAPSAAHHAYLQFSLASLMLTVTLCAVLLGASTVLPGLGIVLAILAAPAFLHTAVTALRRREHGRAMQPMEKVLFFGGSLGAIVVTLLGAGIAFSATCWAGVFVGLVADKQTGGQHEYGLGLGLRIGVGLGLLAGLVALVFLIRLFVRIYRRRGA